MNKKNKTIYICFEGCDGVGKGTQLSMLEEYFQSNKIKYLSSKEPGTSHLKTTEELRNFTLNSDYKEEISDFSREYILQAIRSIHLEKLIYPELKKGDFQYILQDRGVFSGLAYGKSNGLKKELLISLNNKTIQQSNKLKLPTNDITNLYDILIYFHHSSKSDKYLNRAGDKKEFKNGDVLENKGSQYQDLVKKNYLYFINNLMTKKNVPRRKKKSTKFHIINIEHKNGIQKSKEEIFKEVLNIIDNYDK